MFERYFESPLGWALLVGVLFLVLMTNAFHEGAHALGAWVFGDRRESIRRRCTLNPVAHFSWFLTFVLPVLSLVLLGGQALLGGAKPVLIRRDSLSAVGFALAALAGPIGNLVFAGLLGWMVSYAMHTDFAGMDIDPARSWLWALVKLPLWFSVFLAALNLLPLPGLDGGHIVSCWMKPEAFAVWMRFRFVTAIVIIGGLLWVGGMLHSWVGADWLRPPGPEANPFVRLDAWTYEGLSILEQRWDR